jgi:hypothetical protein
MGTLNSVHSLGWLQELARTKLETEAKADAGIFLPEFAGNQKDPTISRRKSSTWLALINVLLELRLVLLFLIPLYLHAFKKMTTLRY